MIIEWYRELFLFLWNYLGFFGAIVGISIIVSLACFPIYNVVGRIVGMENDLQSALLPAIAKIRESYKDAAERQSAVERLYSRFGYHPIMGVRKVLPLFVSIPFLMLTYYMLAGTVELEGVEWLCFNDLSKPDRMLFGINALPFVMTGINLLTVYATPCFNKKDEVQAWVIAIFFLIILYSANTALMIYWTLNQFFNFLRSLYINNWSGAKLLFSRVISLKHAPKKINSWLTPKVLAYVSFVFLLITLYMYVMIVKAVWFFNCFASKWLICPMMCLLICSTYLMQCRAKVGLRKLGLLVTVLAVIYFVVHCAAIGSILFTYKVLQVVTANVEFLPIFYVLLLIWFVCFVLPMIGQKALVELREAIKVNWHWLTLIPILAIHYSFASENFKLPLDSICMLTFYMLLPALVLSMFCALAFYRFADAKKIFALALGACVGAYLVPMISQETGKLTGYESNLVIRLCFMAVIALAVLHVKQRKFAISFLAILLVAVSFNAWQLKREYNERNGADVVVAKDEVREQFDKLKCIHHNSIYLLVYDSYAHNTILDGLGIKHMDINRVLGERGFTSYDAYSVGSDTVLSMGSSFEIGGVASTSKRATMSGDNVFNDFLQRAGYKTSYILGSYDIPGHGERMPGDFYFPSPKEITRPEKVIFSCITRGYLSQAANTFDSYTEEEWLEARNRQILQSGAEKSFVYAHGGWPGHAIANPMYRKSEAEELSDYEKRLETTDKKICEDVDFVLSKGGDPIIIVASDHGGCLTLTDKPGTYDAFNLLDRCGIQLHIRWPKDYKKCLDVNLLGNAFLEVMIYLTGDRSLAKYASDGSSLYVQMPFRAPPGAIKGAIIQSGIDKGKNLFEAARDRVQ